LRAIHIKGVFSVRDIVVLSGAEKSYTYQIVRRLLASSDIEEGGYQVNPVGRKEKVLRVRHRDEFFRKYVLAVNPKGDITKGGAK
jgi:hypothetical protein